MSDIKYGSSGENVKKLQSALIEQGYDLGAGGADGIFGDDTYEAVRAYQKDNGLDVDGIVGENTSSALFGSMAAQNTTPSAATTGATGNIKYGSSGGDVKKLQSALMEQGYDLGIGGADGIFGDDTYEAVRAYQKDNGLDVDGIVGENTSSALFGSTDEKEDAHNTLQTGSSSQGAEELAALRAEIQGLSGKNDSYVEALAQQQAQNQQLLAELQGLTSKNDSYAQILAEQKAQNKKMVSRLEELYSENGAYAKALEEQKAANDAAVNQAVGSLEAQKTDANRSYADMFRQLYIDKMNAQKNIGQQMAAQGITGGAAESTMLGLGTSYEEALRQGEQERIGVVGDLDKAITDTRLTGDLTNAAAAAADAKERTNSYAAVLQNLLSRNDSLASADMQMQNSMNERAKAYAYQTAMQILQGGNMVSDDLLAQAGISAADAQAIVGQALTAKKEKDAEKLSAENENAKAYAYKVAMQILQGGNMPSDTLLATAGISKADAQAAMAANATSQTESDVLIRAISALTQGTNTPLSESEVKSLWDGGYDFSDYAEVLPALKEYLGEPETPVTENGTNYYTNNPMNVDYDEETGEFIWANMIFDDLESMLDAINASGLGRDVFQEIVRKLNSMGINAKITD